VPPLKKFEPRAPFADMGFDDPIAPLRAVGTQRHEIGTYPELTQ